MKDLSENNLPSAEIICLNPNMQPVVGYVEFVFDALGTSAISKIKPDGSVGVPTIEGSLPEIAVIKPTDGHWPIVISPKEQQDCVCPKMSVPEDLLWWRRLPFGDNGSVDWKSDVRVGIIDIPARRCSSLQHVSMFDIEGQCIEESELAESSHGLRVAAMISERGAVPERTGIAPSTNAILIDVTDDDLDGEWDYSKIAPAIQILVDEFDVDLINISGGCPVHPDDPRYEDACSFFNDALDYASKQGVLVVAATGNDQSATVALPARLEDALGVGAVGKAQLAPDMTRTKAYEVWAKQTPGCFGSCGQHVLFHYRDTTFGKGLDVVGPGIGVVMAFEDGSCVEFDGTSYAAPYVTGVISWLLSADEHLGRLKGRDRLLQLRSHIEMMCVDLGMEKARQGSGIPVFINQTVSKPC